MGWKTARMPSVSSRVNRGKDESESGFTLMELMITIAVMSIVLLTVTQLFLMTWRLWKSNWTELRVQQGARTALERITLGLRHARPGSVTIDSGAGEANYSRLKFTHVNNETWWVYKEGWRLYVDLRSDPDVSGTISFLTDGVEAMQFAYPSFQDISLVDVGITISATAYQVRGIDKMIRVQLTQRVRLRNP